MYNTINTEMSLIMLIMFEINKINKKTFVELRKRTT